MPGGGFCQKIIFYLKVRLENGSKKKKKQNPLIPFPVKVAEEGKRGFRAGVKTWKGS